MHNFIGKKDIIQLRIEDIIKSVYKPLDEKTEKLMSYIKTKRFEDFSKQLKETSVKFNNNDIFTHKIDLDHIIQPYKYLSAGANGITFLAKFKKKGKGPNRLIVKYEVVRDNDYFECQRKFFDCIDQYKDYVNQCKVKEIYCRLNSAFIEIYINKNYIQTLNCSNFAMFYAFFMCPTYTISFEKNKKTPTKNFINKYIENKQFCVDNDEEKIHVFSAYEYIPGKTLSSYIESNQFQLKDLYDIFLQIFGALSIAQVPNTIYYNHNDLHCNNIMIEKLNKKREYQYIFPFEKTINRLHSNKRAVIIDQGNASLLMKKDDKYEGVFGWYKRKISKVLKNFDSPYADVYRIITNSYKIMIYYYKSEKDINDLKNIINLLFSISSNKNLSTICSDFIENNQNIWFDYYVEYLKEKLSKYDFFILMKKIEKISYEYAYNYFHYNT